MTAHRPELRVPDPFKPEPKESTDYWEVFIQPECKWSDKALKLLEENGETDVKVIDVVEGHFVKQSFANGWASTPIIYKNSKPFGGYPELVWYFQRTMLDPDLALVR